MPEITRDEALAALRSAAWAEEIATCGHPGCVEHRAEGRKRIHTFAGPIGATWGLDEAEFFVAASDRIAWAFHPFGHDLGIRSGGRVVYFDVRRPAEVS